MNFAAAVVAPTYLGINSNRIVGSSFTGAWPPQGDVNAGQVGLSGTVTISSLTIPANNRVSPDGPFTNAALGIAPVDDDGVRILVYDLDSDNSGGIGGPDHKTLGPPTTLYFGELRLVPAIGSELLPLNMTAEILRWSGVGFVTNGDDSCTQIPAARLGLSNWTKNLSAGETTLPASALTFASGRASIGLTAPGGGNDGSVLVTSDLINAGMPYLTGRWGGAAKYDKNPSAVAAFGLYKGAGQIIHFQENY
jgi:MSHA biogenesis protein MshQ